MPTHSAPQSSFRWSFGSVTTTEERRALVSQPLATPPSCALARFHLKPATITIGARRAGGNYACLASNGTRIGEPHSGDESGDEEDRVLLPQHGCRRCCLLFCVLLLMLGGTATVLRFLLARDSHPSSPAAMLVAKGRVSSKPALRGPKTTLASAAATAARWSNRTAVWMVRPSASRPSHPPPPVIGLDHVSLPRPPIPPFPSPPPLADSMSPQPPPPPPPNPHAARPATPFPWHSVPHRGAAPGPLPPPPPPSPPLPLREMGLLTIPAVAAWVAKEQSAQPLPSPLFPGLEPLFSALVDIANKSNEVAIGDS